MTDPWDLEVGPWTCPYCGAVLESWSAYQRHRQEHLEPRVYAALWIRDTTGNQSHADELDSPSRPHGPTTGAAKGASMIRHLEITTFDYEPLLVSWVLRATVIRDGREMCCQVAIARREWDAALPVEKGLRYERRINVLSPVAQVYVKDAWRRLLREETIVREVMPYDEHDGRGPRCDGCGNPLENIRPEDRCTCHRCGGEFCNEGEREWHLCPRESR